MNRRRFMVSLCAAPMALAGVKPQRRGVATIFHVIRWADNTKELQRNLADGKRQMEALRAGVDEIRRTMPPALGRAIREAMRG